MTLGVRTRALLWVISCPILILLAYQFADRPWATLSHDLLKRPQWGVWMTWLANLPVPLAIATPLYVITMRPKRSQMFWAAAAATLLATLAVLVLKYVAGRTWPETWVHGNPSWITDHVFGFTPLHGGAGWSSFPSGHTTRVSAPMAVLWHAVPSQRAVWALPVLLVTVGLLLSNYHWLSDCIAGIYLGAACASASLLVFREKK